MIAHTIAPFTRRELEEVCRTRYGDFSAVGWGPRTRRRFTYFTPDEFYEAVVNRLVTPSTRWLDVGCGRHVFPSNARLARMLADRCSELVGIDPDETIEENALLHERVRTTLEDFRTDRPFDVVTLRMVAEHVADPPQAVGALSRLTRPGAHVVVYTVNKRSPMSLLSAWTPFGLHDPLKRRLWGTEEKDTFPVWYRMNTRRALHRLFEPAGFREREFVRLDDCRAFAAARFCLLIELTAWRALRAIGVGYPESCLLGVYERR